MGKLTFPEKTIFVCDGKKCGRHSDVRKWLKEEIKQNDLKNEVELVRIECTDRCKHAPILCFQPANRWFAEVSERDVKKLFEEFIMD
ncbi:(2Fe-2S) ferredoxin domain-containing protein [Arundinibacter roseus]|uniref:(2Fe-2S) ferredoxin domain-containing protein n=1 Tax=Arundinibacter roseus TaxID=2070510 RepID=A0A4V2X946_9BACT|nr:(2Fe-2S) ferredoxin domain-containing protein [Arundinibacter roseus]TDB62365.1 (2Fe-2S) ferredoxin domain-containing protein [Arundinibacter roseus]